MDLSIDHLNPRREAIGQNAARFPCQCGQKGAGGLGIGLIHMQGGGQLAFQRIGDGQHLPGIAGADHDAKGAEDLLGQDMVAQPVLADTSNR